MTDVNLLPCRCGGKPTLQENAEHWFRVACPECASSTIWRSRANAIAEWNHRPSPAVGESDGYCDLIDWLINAPSLRCQEAADRIASLSAEVERLKEKQRIGLAAAAIVTEIAACVPLKDTIEATRTGRTLVDWVKSTVAHAESAAQKMREALEREHRT